MHGCEGTAEVKTGVIIALDVGGTTVKSALCNDSGDLLTGISTTPVDSKASKATILESFNEIVTILSRAAAKAGLPLSGLALAFPGPFDYERGICLIRGVEKYEALYGMNLKSFFRSEVLADGSIPILFDADSWAFARGQYHKGAARGAERFIGLTIGTGLGSAFMERGSIVENERGIPPYGWIGNLPYGKGILDDRVSRRGILARYGELTGEIQGSLDVEDLFNLAESGNTKCMQVFRETGILLATALAPFIEAFHPDCIVMGGKISEAFKYMAPALNRRLEELLEKGNVPKILKATGADSSALSGVALYLVERYLKGGRTC